jgi:hypothetical protein
MLLFLLSKTGMLICYLGAAHIYTHPPSPHPCAIYSHYLSVDMELTPSPFFFPFPFIYREVVVSFGEVS